MLVVVEFIFDFDLVLILFEVLLKVVVIRFFSIFGLLVSDGLMCILWYFLVLVRVMLIMLLLVLLVILILVIFFWVFCRFFCIFWVCCISWVILLCIVFYLLKEWMELEIIWVLCCWISICIFGLFMKMVFVICCCLLCWWLVC